MNGPKYVLRWWYSDNSGSGVYRQIFSESQREGLIDLIPILNPNVEWEFVEVSE